MSSQSKIAKRNSEAKFMIDLRKWNRKPTGGSWNAADKRCTHAVRSYRKAVRAEGNAIISDAMRGE